MSDYDYDVVIVGAGVSGLRTALELESADVSYRILEKDHRVGGRVRSYERDGFIMDRGFQILLTAYPEVRETLDLNQLDLKSFMSGASIRTPEGWSSLMDPLSHPIGGLQSLVRGPGSLLDKWRIYRLRRTLGNETIDSFFEGKEMTTGEYLTSYGFSDEIIDQFFRPFFSGVFLEDRLETSRSMFQFVYKMFGEGQAALPSGGMQAIPEQMAARLPESVLQVGTEVRDMSAPKIRLGSGETLRARFVVDATCSSDRVRDRTWNGTNCYYFKVKEPPVREPILCLNAGSGSINNLCFPSRINSNYAPHDWDLLSVSTLREEGETVGRIRGELVEWFGTDAEEWSLLGRYELDRALPEYTPGSTPDDPERFRPDDRLYRTGDVLTTPSLNGALKSGRRVGEQLVRDLKNGS